jgi:hypothetical protein
MSNLLEFIQLEGGMKIMKHFKGAAPATRVCEPLVYSKLICQSVVHKNNYEAKVINILNTLSLQNYVLKYFLYSEQKVGNTRQ